MNVPHYYMIYTLLVSLLFYNIESRGICFCFSVRQGTCLSIMVWQNVWNKFDLRRILLVMCLKISAIAALELFWIFV